MQPPVLFGIVGCQCGIVVSSLLLDAVSLFNSSFAGLLQLALSAVCCCCYLSQPLSGSVAVVCICSAPLVFIQHYGPLSLSDRHRPTDEYAAAGPLPQICTMLGFIHDFAGSCCVCAASSNQAAGWRWTANAADLLLCCMLAGSCYF